MKVLVIEDDRSTLTLIEKIFGETVDCTSCATAMEGIDHFVNNMISFDSYDAVLMDINLPDLNGVHCLNLLRRFEAVKGVVDNRKARIIMMTGTADEDNVKASLKNGCDQFLIKPVSKEKIDAKFKAVGLKLNFVEKVEKPAAPEAAQPEAAAEPAAPEAAAQAEAAS